MDVLFPARLQVVLGSGILLEPCDFKAELWEFCKKRAEWEEKKGTEVLVEAELRVYYRRRTAAANRLQWAICRRLKSVEGFEQMTVEEIHDGFAELYYPTYFNEISGKETRKDGKDLSTVEYAKVVELFAMEAVNRGAKIRDIWILFTDWRWQQKTDPLEGSYSSFEEYRELHPCCEACGVFLLEENEAGEWIHTGEGAYIVPQSEGGPDDDWNRFIFCAKCYRAIQHGTGWEPLLAMYSWCAPKCQKAWARCGKKDKSGRANPPTSPPVSGKTDRFQSNNSFPGKSGENKMEKGVEEGAEEIQGTFEVLSEEKIEEKRDREFKNTLDRLQAIANKGRAPAKNDEELFENDGSREDVGRDFDPNPSRQNYLKELEEQELMGSREVERRGEGVGAEDGTSPVEGEAEGEAGLDSSAPLSDLEKAERSKYGLF